MSLLSLISTMFDPVAELVDNLHTSDEEEMDLENKAVEIKNHLVQLQNNLASQVIDLEKKYLEAKSSIIVAETKSGHWITSAWRPMVMLLFAFIIFNAKVFVPYMMLAFDWETKMNTIDPQMWSLLKLGLGGYIGGRSLEKTAGVITTIANKLSSQKREL